MKLKRNLKDLLNADEDRMVDILTEDGFLPDGSKMKCPFCNNSAVSSLQKRDGLPPRYRCRSKNCHKFILRHHLHPVFTSGKGAEGHSLAVQGCALLLRLASVPLSSIHILLDMNHKAVERIEKSLAFARKAYVESHQKAMSFGFAKGQWMEVEADEAVFDKFLLPSEDSPVQSRVMKWEQWLGMVARGKPSSLVLIRLPCVTTRKRAPGPGAIKKVHWTKIAKTWLKGRNIILHTDSARSYKAKVAGVLHDSVVHQKKRVVDRAWRFIKDRLKINQNVKCNSTLLQAKIRSAQFEYWQSGKDAWTSTGELFTWRAAAAAPTHDDSANLLWYLTRMPNATLGPYLQKSMEFRKFDPFYRRYYPAMREGISSQQAWEIKAWLYDPMQDFIAAEVFELLYLRDPVVDAISSNTGDRLESLLREGVWSEGKVRHGLQALWTTLKVRNRAQARSAGTKDAAQVCFSCEESGVFEVPGDLQQPLQKALEWVVCLANAHNDDPGDENPDC
eukprot:s56_g13.t3